MEDETMKCKKCESKNILGVQYSWDDPEHWDGLSEIECRDCGARIGRWSGKELAEGEVEKASARFAVQ